MGANVEKFIPFATVTDKMVMSGPDAFVNDSTNYHTYSWAQAWSLKKSLQATAEIQDFIILGKDRRARLVNSNTKIDPKANAAVTKYSTGWATILNDNAFTDEELEFNEDVRRAQYKKLYSLYVIPMHTDTADFMEDLMWKVPVEAMETVGVAGVRTPFSIPALITVDGLAASGFSSSTVMGINPSNDTGWKNQFELFTDFKSQIESRLFRARQHTNFRAPAGVKPGSFTGTPMDRKIIYADLKSIEELTQILRDSNDRLRGFGEYEGQLFHDNTPIVWAEPLGDVTIAATAQRLFGVNFDFLYPIVHKNHFMELLPAPYGGDLWKPSDQPLSNAIYELTRYNWWMKSRRRQFVIAHESNSW